jgi:chromatin segregation and condensation protein Rec8/ScpA/Scc1 (kleisin family)
LAEEGYSLHKPPLNLLVDPTALRHVKPWQVDIKYLLDLFRQALSSAGFNFPPLHLHASAILSTSTLYRLKVENLYTAEKGGGQRRRPSSLGDVPAVLTMAFRQEVGAGDIEELLASLEKILLSAEAREPPSSDALSQPPEPWEPDTFTVRIQKDIGELRLRLASLFSQKPEIMFSEMVEKSSPIEAARLFILLLFLAQEGSILLEDVGDDIRVTGVGPPSA